MIKRYVLPLDRFIFEAANPTEGVLNSAKQKYDAAAKKDAEDYAKYTKGEITKEQYMQLFDLLLQTEQELRRAQINYKIENARGAADAEAAKKPGAPPQNPNMTNPAAPPLPG